MRNYWPRLIRLVAVRTKKKRLRNKSIGLYLKGYMDGYGNVQFSSNHKNYQRGWHEGWLDLIGDIAEDVNDYVKSEK